MRRRRGFSLVDVAVSVSLVAVTTIVSARFIVALNDSSSSSLSAANARRAVTLVNEKLHDDLSRITVCSNSRVGSPFVAINDSTSEPVATGVAFYTDLPADDGSYGSVDMVGWRVEGSTIQRAEVRNTGSTSTTLGCETLSLSSATWVDVTSPVEAPTDTNTTYFQGVTDGVDQSYAGLCTGDLSSSCNFGALRVRFSLRPDSGVVTSYDELYSIPTGVSQG